MLGRHPRECGDPAAHEDPVRVLVQRLLERVVDPRSVDSGGARLHLHLRVVDAGLVVEELARQVQRGRPPWLPQLVAGEADQHRAHAEVDPAGGQQHAHAGIHHREAGLAARRTKIVSQRTELISQVRGLASEYGVTFPTSRAALMAGLPLALEDADNGLTHLARFALLNVLEDIRALDSRLAALALQTAALAQQEPAYARLLTVPGFGPVVAPTFIAAVGDGKQFEHGRDVSAWLGIVPKQHGTGGKVQLMRISKNGDRDLRTLLIHGARAVLRWVDRRDDAMSRWLVSLRARRGEARTIVALANKLARIGWAVLRGDQDFDVDKAFRPRAVKQQTAAA